MVKAGIKGARKGEVLKNCNEDEINDFLGTRGMGMNDMGQVRHKQ